MTWPFPDKLIVQSIGIENFVKISRRFFINLACFFKKSHYLMRTTLKIQFSQEDQKAYKSN